MFSTLNEIGNNSHFRTTTVVVVSIGTAAFLYVLVAITGYLSFGNAIRGNIVAMCKLLFPFYSPRLGSLQLHRLTINNLNHRQSRYRHSRHVLLRSPSSSMQSLRGRSIKMAAEKECRPREQLSIQIRSLAATF